MGQVTSEEIRLDANKYARLQSGDRFRLITPDFDGTIEIPNATGGNAFEIAEAASGRIRVIAANYGADAVRIGSGHDPQGKPLEVYDSVFTTHYRDPDNHQDGMQSCGGALVTYRRCLWVTYVESTQGLFFQAADGRPTDIVAEDCVIAGIYASSVVYGDGTVRCGCRRTLVQRGKSYDFRHKEGAVDEIDEDNEAVPANDPVLQACIDQMSVAPWLEANGIEPPPDGGGGNGEPDPPPDPIWPDGRPDWLISESEKVRRMWREMEAQGWSP